MKPMEKLWKNKIPRFDTFWGGGWNGNDLLSFILLQFCYSLKKRKKILYMYIYIYVYNRLSVQITYGHLQNEVEVITGSNQCIQLLGKDKSKQHKKIHTSTIKSVWSLHSEWES